MKLNELYEVMENHEANRNYPRLMLLMGQQQMNILGRRYEYEDSDEDVLSFVERYSGKLIMRTYASGGPDDINEALCALDSVHGGNMLCGYDRGVERNFYIYAIES